MPERLVPQTRSRTVRHTSRVNGDEDLFLDSIKVLLSKRFAAMKLSNMTRAFLVIVLFLIIAISSMNTKVEARTGPSFGQRRLLNLSGNSVTPTEVPNSLLVATGHKLHLVLQGDGVQEYVFKNGLWTLFNASATLSSFAGQEVGVHFYSRQKNALVGQPTWQSFAPESIVTGAPSVKVSVSADAIPWVLLSATETSGSLNQFGDVTFVQRLYTEGGLAPGASYAATEGEVFKSSYKAIYFFYKSG